MTVIEKPNQPRRHFRTAAVAVGAVLFSLAVPPTADAATTADSAMVTLCSDTGLQGRCFTFPVGAVPDLSRTGLGRQTLSSIQVPPGLMVRVFTSTDYTGSSGLVVGDRGDGRAAEVDDLRSPNVGVLLGTLPNDTASSLVVESSVQLAVVACSDSYLRGACQAFTASRPTGTPDLRGSVVGNDTISSLWVLGNAAVTLYSDIQYQGAKGTVSGNTFGGSHLVVNDLQRGDRAIHGAVQNDSISSLKTEFVPAY